MSTHSSLPQALVQAPGGDTLARVAPRRALRGFGNLLQNEHRAWWRTRKWLVHLLIWLAIINAFVGLISWVELQEGKATAEVYAETVQVFFLLGGMAAAIGVVVTAQGTIVGEKQLGTAAWIMSKPASRGAFVLAKLVAHAGGLLGLALVLPSLVFYAQNLFLVGTVPPLVSFVGGLAVAALHLLFYLAFIVLLGTLFNARGPIAGIGIGFLMSGQIVPDFLPQLSAYVPWTLPGTAAALVLGQQPPAGAFIAIGATTVWTVLCIAGALWQWGREEF